MVTTSAKCTVLSAVAQGNREFVGRHCFRTTKTKGCFPLDQLNIPGLDLPRINRTGSSLPDIPIPDFQDIIPGSGFPAMTNFSLPDIFGINHRSQSDHRPTGTACFCSTDLCSPETPRDWSGQEAGHTERTDEDSATPGKSGEDSTSHDSAAQTSASLGFTVVNLLALVTALFLSSQR